MFHDEVPVKGGVICKSCYDALPVSIQSSIKNFTVKQIQQFKQIATPFRNPELVWRYCEKFQICVDSIVLNKTEYKLRDLRSVKLNFHPTAIGTESSTAIGIVTLVIETKSPHFLIEEAFAPTSSRIRYSISGMRIYYHYNTVVEQWIREIQEAIRSKSYSLRAIKNEEDRKYREKKEREARARTEQAQKKTHSHTHSEQTQQKKTRQEQHQTPPPKQAPPKTELQKALEVFDLKIPFTDNELKKRRKKMIMEQRLHPDQGGDAETFKRVQAAYELLLKFATKEQA